MGCDADPVSEGSTEPDSVDAFSCRNARLTVVGVVVGGVGFLAGAVVPTTSPWRPVSLAARLTYIAALLLLLRVRAFQKPGPLRRPRTVAQTAHLPVSCVGVLLYLGLTALILGTLVNAARVFA